jgi:hypothetical protein
VNLDAGCGLAAVAVEPGAFDGFAAGGGLEEDVGPVPVFFRGMVSGGAFDGRLLLLLLLLLLWVTLTYQGPPVL